MERYMFGYYPTDTTNVGSMDEWMAWYKEIGADVISNSPVKDGGQEVSADTQVEITPEMYQMRAYDNFKAESMDAAVELSKSCPLIKNKLGFVRIYELMDMPKM